MTRFYADNLLLEERNKCFEFDKRYGFVREQQFALQNDWNEEVMYQKSCHVAVKHEKPVDGEAKCETQTMNATFGKTFAFDLLKKLFRVMVLYGKL